MVGVSVYVAVIATQSSYVLPQLARLSDRARWRLIQEQQLRAWHKPADVDTVALPTLQRLLCDSPGVYLEPIDPLRLERARRAAHA